MSYLKQADLNIHWKGIELHWANERDPRGQGVHELVLLINPDAFQLRQDGVGLKGFQVQDLDIRKPKISEQPTKTRWKVCFIYQERERKNASWKTFLSAFSLA